MDSNECQPMSAFAGTGGNPAGIQSNRGIMMGREILDEVHSQSVVELLSEEAKIPREKQLQHNLADNILTVVDSPIAQQSQCLEYGRTDKLELFRTCWTIDDVGNQTKSSRHLFAAISWPLRQVIQ
jgi:hypothetical protein